MVDKNDWRVRNQEKYLMGAVFHWKKYKQPSKEWDHDHCEFCWTKFMEIRDDDIYNEGYNTTDNNGKCSWVCKECFDDFKETFQWLH